MGSTDSATGDSCHTGPASSCGLVSTLFPNSCRGRAEAFARRLHRRLTSLGGTDGDDDDDDEHNNIADDVDSTEKATEKSWLQSSHTNCESTTLSNNYVHERQPRHSPESDLYYDFDFSPDHQHHGADDDDDDDGDTGSPDEAASVAEVANLHVNVSQNDDENRDPESGCVFSSPLNLTPSDEGNNSDIYYDPESSEGDKTRTEDFYDPVTTDTDSGNLTKNSEPEVSKPPGRRRVDKPELIELNGHVTDPKESTDGPVCSSDESNDVASSLDTTSPSHESLWSTFDESTVSQDSLSSLLILPRGNQVHVTKSYSDSDLIPRHTRVPPINLDSTSSSDELDYSHEPHHNGVDEKFEHNYSIYSSRIDIPGALVVECLLDKQSSVHESLKNQVNLNVDDNCDDTKVDDGQEKEKQEKVVEEEEEEEEEIERPRRLRRCSSLKTGKTPPGTPGRKKIVRFADVLGLDLADVRTFLDEIPKIPNSAYSDLIYDDVFQKDTSPYPYESNTTGFAGLSLNNLPITTSINGVGTKPAGMLVILFQQPAGQSNFLDLVRDRQVCLENVTIEDPVMFCIRGTVRVRNLDFHKSVHVRYTLDNWRNFSDLQAVYVENSCDGFSDKFIFQLYCHTLKIGERLELAVRFQCKGSQYWDNNDGANYCFQCLPTTPAVGYIPAITTSRRNNTRDWSPTFY